MSIAAFVRRIYIEIIDKYFPKASFHKPTGDGLLIVIPYTAVTLEEVLCSTVRDCLEINQNFRSLVQGDHLINFETPERIGIGMSRGVACRISSNGTIVDYSGKVINLASRLNGFARPSGVIFDSGFGLGLLPKKTQELFVTDSIYIVGVAEEKPIVVHYTRQHTIVPASAKQPMTEPEWFPQKHVTDIKTMKKCLSDNTKQLLIQLDEKPLDEKQITLDISYQEPRGIRRHIFLDANSTPELKYGVKGNKHLVAFPIDWLVRDLDKFGVREDAEIVLDLCYSIARK